jgi:hypothetical protein
VQSNHGRPQQSGLLAPQHGQHTKNTNTSCTHPTHRAPGMSLPTSTPVTPTQCE